MNGDTLGILLTVCLFGSVGLVAARRMFVPVRLYTWALLVIAVVLGFFVGVNTIISVLGVTLRLNWAIVSCCLGIVAGLVVRTRTFTRSAARTA